MEISVEELASLLQLTVAQSTPAEPKKNPTRYNLVYGEVFKEVAPMFGHPGPRTEQFGKLVSRVHAITKERLNS